MHVKFMHKFHSLLPHIPTYLHVMRFYNHIFIDFWGFFIDPLIWDVTLQNRKYMFCVFLSFKDLPKLKRSKDFFGLTIFP
jgi:hypothetical protein